jgi:phenylalanyl-tRNA synthetase beta chain
MNYTLTSLDSLKKLAPDNAAPAAVKVVNPMSAEQEYLRPTLRAGLLATLASNLRYEEGGIRLFELGKVFIGREHDLPAEPESLCGLLAGTRGDRTWLGNGGDAYGFYDVKGLIEALMVHLGVKVQFEPSADPGLHPARQAAVVVEGEAVTVKLGVIGEVHPVVADAFELIGTVCLFELNTTNLVPFTVGYRRYDPVPRYPAVNRDLALVVDEAVQHRQVAAIMDGFSLVSRIELFDVYSGKQVPAGKKSLAYRIVYQSATHTLKDEEVNKVQEAILRKLSSELGVTLRA